MKSSTRLDSAVFQLTPTRTRCDLIIIANEKKEKIASGLLNPFLAHLKTAEDQIAKGGYSILLQPDPGSNAMWFTKGTVERFVRFVSTPEILERVYTIESEILQINEAIAFQGSNDLGLSTVEDHQEKPTTSSEGNKPLLGDNEEKAIVLYMPSSHPPETNGSYKQEENSKFQLLKVMETRRIVLQKEQGMAFARAVAAGFEIDNLALLVSFAECFGASRLMKACLRFIDLWKGKHESGQWVEIEAADVMSSRSEFSSMNASGIVLTSVANKQNESIAAFAPENCADDKPPIDHQVQVGPQQNFQGQFPHPMFSPWPIHSPPGTVPLFQSYPMQGMPYYQNYSGTGPFYQPPYPPLEDPRLNVAHRTGQKRQSMDGGDSQSEEKWNMDASNSKSQDDLDLGKEASQRKAGRSGKKQSGTVIIRNINYISKAKKSTSSESESASDSAIDTDDEDLQADDSDIMHRNTMSSSRRKGKCGEPKHESNFYVREESSNGKEPDGSHWQAFQNCLLRSADEDDHAAKQSMFSMEKEVRVKRRQNIAADDPLALGRQDTVEGRERSITEFQNVSGNGSRVPRRSGDEVLISRGGEGHQSTKDQIDIQSTEINGKVVYRTAGDDFIIGGRVNHSNSRSSSDPLAVNGFEYATNNLDRKSSHMADESFIVPLRSLTLDQAGNTERTSIYMDSELPSAYHKSGNMPNGIVGELNYEPNDLSLLPERGTEKTSTGYDPALDYKMQACVKDSTTLDQRNKEVVTDVQQGPKKLDKNQRSKHTPDTLDKRKPGGPIRKGKPSKLSPLDDARARAEKLRTYKAELQKIKKEKEEEQAKRLEALKMERQKRIAARGSSTTSQSLPSLQSRKLPTKLSPISHKGSKFSDSEPGSSSPLQRSKIRTLSLGASDSQKTSKSIKASGGNNLAGSRVSRSLTSLAEPKSDSSEVPPDSKASKARIRRLSEPKTISSHPSTSMKSRSTEATSKPKVSDGSESKKISAIMKLDKSKAATLPELKIKTSKGASNMDQNKIAAEETAVNVNAVKPSITVESHELKMNHEKISHSADVDDNPIVEKNVVMLECEKSSVPTICASEIKVEPGVGHIGDHQMGLPEYAAIHASPSLMDAGHSKSISSQFEDQTSSYEFTTDYDKRGISSVAVEKPYQAPYARLSSLEDRCTGKSDYGKAPPTSSAMVSPGLETVKAHVSDSKDTSQVKIPEALDKFRVKESPKGFRRLLKLGKKNHSSSAGDKSVESDNASAHGSEQDDNVTSTAASSEVHMLKNLISQDETPTAANTSQKPSRHFSLLSPFRSKTGEKKAMA